VIQTGSVDRNPIPSMQHITGDIWIFVRGCSGLAMKLRAIKIAESAGGAASKSARGDGK
jgi:hypothetical protein